VYPARSKMTCQMDSCSLTNSFGNCREKGPTRLPLLLVLSSSKKHRTTTMPKATSPRPVPRHFPRPQQHQLLVVGRDIHRSINHRVPNDPHFASS
jgi:hypothetical protein